MDVELTEVAFDYSTLGQKEPIIRGIAERIKKHAVKAVESLLEIGEELTTAKGIIPHGDFTNWVLFEFDAFKWTDRTARNYMAAAKHFKTETVSNFTPSAMYLLSSPSVPEAARIEAKELAAAGEKITPAKAEEIKAKHVDSCPNCGGTEWGDDEDGRFCLNCKDPGDVTPEPRVIERDLSEDQEPVISRTQRKNAADLRAKADVIIRQVIEGWPADDFDELEAWWKSWRKEIKKGND